MLDFTVLLDGTAPAAGTAGNAPQGDAWTTILMFGGIILIFYFFMIRPQQKKQKKLREERNAMTKGTNVVTAGGIYGKIREVADTYFMIEIDNNVKIKVDKNSVYPSADSAATDAQNGTVANNGK